MYRIFEIYLLSESIPRSASSGSSVWYARLAGQVDSVHTV